MFQKILHNRFVRVTMICLASIAVAISLVSYSEYDNSFNTASQIEYTNLLGPFGAYLSDIMMQYFGIASWLILLTLFSLSINEIREASYRGLTFKIFTSLCAASCLNIFLALYLQEASIVLYAHLASKIALLSGEYEIIAEILLLALSIILFLYSLGFKARDYKALLNIMFIFRPIFKSSTISPETSTPRNISMNAKTERTTTRIALEYTHSPQDDGEEGIGPIISDKAYKSNSSLRQHNESEEDGFMLPDLDLLSNQQDQKTEQKTPEELELQSEELLSVLKDFGVRGNIVCVNQGPVVSLYEFEPAAGTKSSRVISLSDDIARSLSAISARIATVPGRNVLGIELPNDKREFFRLRTLLESPIYSDQNIQLPIILGKDIAGKPCVVDLAKMPHLLVAGTTGSGKSVAINTMILSLLYRHTPKQCRFIMIDPKMLELSVYDNIPHLLAPVVTEPGKAVVALKWAVREMENRYRLMSNIGVRNINGYNTKITEALNKGDVLMRTVQTGFDIDTGKPIFESLPIEMEPLPFIVIIVDEMADLMLVAGKDIESSIQRLAQMARAAGIHLIMATQRPSVDVITGVIKANFPSRISFKVTSKIDSRTILGEQGAEQLLGMGDMLYMGNSSRIQRVHCPFVDDAEVERISKFLQEQGLPEYIEAVTTADDDSNPLDDALSESDDGSDDGLYKQAVQIVRSEKKASISYVQRCLRIGYNRAAILIERMESDGIVSPPNHSGKREVLIDD